MAKIKHKFTKYIKESYRYYQDDTQICPDADDIIADVVSLVENETGITLTDEDIAQLEFEVNGKYS